VLGVRMKMKPNSDSCSPRSVVDRLTANPPMTAKMKTRKSTWPTE
jgi:hypothetical protein